MTDTTPGRDAREAHVQVLTAEVRTLVVGSRQVTMSVYNQLDDVPPVEIDPFGRVSPKSASGLFVHVVGRHAATGALVRSYVPRHPESLDAKGQLPYGPSTRISYRHWPATAAQQWPPTDATQAQQQLAKVAVQWSALPLIVLAGLR